jgi:DNA polymerase I-like protein with 3'-5' exonuclease and polymerase domains
VRLAFDLETNGFMRQGFDRIHCLVIRDLDTGLVTQYNDQGTHEAIVTGINVLAEASLLVGHNIISYDIEVIHELYPWFDAKGIELCDTLILSRQFFPHILGLDYKVRKAGMPPKLYGRHSLESWGWRLDYHKGDFKDHADWTTWSQEMQDYCVRDVEVTSLLWDRLSKRAEPFQRSVKMEHDCARIMAIQERYGWPFDVKAGEQLESVLRSESEQLAAELRNAFPYVAGKQMTPKRNNSTTGYVEGAPFTKLIDFNPTSRDHIAWVFQTWRDWQPEEFTETNKPKIDETVLMGIDTPEAKTFARMLELQKGLGQLSEGKNSWLKQVTREGRIHHSCSLATSTGRNAHRNPNLGQVSSDPRCRALFGPGDGFVEVGADASGLELRMLGHYLAFFDSGRFADIVVNGDIHQINADATTQELGVEITRKAVKTITYAFLYGAGDEKLGRTVDPLLKGRKAAALGKKVRSAFVKAIPGLGPLLESVKARSKDDTLKALDGRILHLQGKQHAALNYLLQSAGAIVCKNWVVTSWANLDAAGMLGDVPQVYPLGFIHDEIQYAVKPDQVETVERILTNSIVEVGESFNLNVPLAAEAKHGNSWADCH